MVWIENKPIMEVAENVGMTPSSIYVSKWRVLKRLREEILLLADDVPHLCRSVRPLTDRDMWRVPSPRHLTAGSRRRLAGRRARRAGARQWLQALPG